MPACTPLPVGDPMPGATASSRSAPGPSTLRRAALSLLQIAAPALKATATRALCAAWQAEPDAWASGAMEALAEPPGLPGRPERPPLVSPKQVPARSPFTAVGRAGLLHAIAHIEFNAINLALDAAWRFAGMPEAFYADWMRVASEEALHFQLLSEHLATLGHGYGDFDAHDGLWSMAQKTSDDIVARMALVPRTLEARGLDATPPLQAKLARAGDARAVEILALILRDEVGHVAIGNRWYAWLCQRDGLAPLATYRALARVHQAPRLRAPFNLAARRAAGFSEPELAELQADVSP